MSEVAKSATQVNVWWATGTGLVTIAGFLIALAAGGFGWAFAVVLALLLLLALVAVNRLVQERDDGGRSARRRGVLAERDQLDQEEQAFRALPLKVITENIGGATMTRSETSEEREVEL